MSYTSMTPMALLKYAEKNVKRAHSTDFGFKVGERSSYFSLHTNETGIGARGALSV